VSAVAGYALIVALTLAIGKLSKIAGDDDPALAIMRNAIGERGGRIAMGAAIVAMWFCGLSSVTSASRTFYAFARDDGLPFSHVIRKVNPRFKTPPPAIALASILPCILVVITARFSDAVFDAVTSLATTALYVSYGAPIALGVVARLRKKWTRMGPFQLKRGGVAIACVAVAYCAFVLVCFAIPPNVVYGELIGGVIAFIVVLYLVFARNRFHGPKIDLAQLE
jgi:amino acid transporter